MIVSEDLLDVSWRISVDFHDYSDRLIFCMYKVTIDFLRYTNEFVKKVKESDLTILLLKF